MGRAGPAGAGPGAAARLGGNTRAKPKPSARRRRKHPSGERGGKSRAACVREGGGAGYRGFCVPPQQRSQSRTGSAEPPARCQRGAGGRRKGKRGALQEVAVTEAMGSGGTRVRRWGRARGWGSPAQSWPGEPPRWRSGCRGSASLSTRCGAAASWVGGPGHRDGTRGNGFNGKEGSLWLDVREILYSEGGEALVLPPREAVVPHPWRH